MKLKHIVVAGCISMVAMAATAAPSAAGSGPVVAPAFRNCPTVYSLAAYSTGAEIWVSTPNAADSVAFGYSLENPSVIAKGGALTTVAATKTDNSGRDWKVTLPVGSLAQASKYTYLVTVNTGPHTCTQRGRFETHERVAMLVLHRAHVINDSDSAGNGELTFIGRIDGTAFIGFDRSLINLDLGDWTTIWPGVYTGAVHGIGDSVDIGISVVDDDIAAVVGLHKSSLNHDGEGSDDEYDWSSAHTIVPVPSCLCMLRSVPVWFETPGVPWVEGDLEVVFIWP